MQNIKTAGCPLLLNIQLNRMAYGIIVSISFFFIKNLKNLRNLKDFTGCLLIFIVYHGCIQSDEVSEEAKIKFFILA